MGTTGPALFFSPHQDDETLSMGASIVDHVNAGRDVQVILMTNGGSTGVVDQQYGGDMAACVAERDREFKAAVTALGATPVIRPDRVQDGSLTIDYALSVFNEYYAQYGDTASFKTMTDREETYYPAHAESDHYNLGKALRQSGITDARYYVRRWGWDPSVGASLPSGCGFTGKHPKKMRDALLEYMPVGWWSVREDFLFYMYDANAKSCYHT